MNSSDLKKIQNIYDDIAEIYRLFYKDYHVAVTHQGEEIAKALDICKIPRNARILDTSCGIGTQAIGLKLHGFNVSGIDLSPKSISQAHENAKEFGVDIDFQVGNLKDLDRIPADAFDVVLNCGNTLAHFLSTEDLYHAFKQAFRILRKKGVYINAFTDHREGIKTDDFLRDVTIYRDPTKKSMNFQLWTWLNLKKIYRCDDYTIIDNEGMNPELKKVSADFRIWSTQELEKVAQNSGFREPQWIETSQTGHHNPFFVCKAV